MTKYSEVFKKADGEKILDDSEITTLMSFIDYQIDDPFSNESNYFKKIKKHLEDDREELETRSREIIDLIKKRYPSLGIDINSDVDVVYLADILYKFLIKNIKDITYTFIKEYIYNNKNRKALLTKYSDVKLPAYPKEQYGKKENYLLIIKMNDIIKEINKLEIDLDEFLKYVTKSGSSVYIDLFEKYCNDNIILDDGIYEDIMDLFKDSDCYGSLVTKLTTKVYDAIVAPSLDSTESPKFEFLSESDPILSDDDSDEADE